MKKKKVVIIFITLLTLTIVGIGFKIYSKNQDKSKKEKKIDYYTSLIQESNKNFTLCNTLEDKYKSLSELIKVFNDYTNSKAHYSTVDKIFKSEIESMKDTIKKTYTTNISNYTITNLDTTNDKSKIASSLYSLKKELSRIKEQSTIVCSDKEISEYESKINSLISNYEARIEQISKAEQESIALAEAESESKAEEESKKAEQESKEKEEESAKEAEMNKIQETEESSGNYIENNTPEETQQIVDNSGTPINILKSGKRYTYFEITNPDGSVGKGYRDEDGNLYDENGDFIYNISDY